jgi:hypothetical protein
MRKLIFAVTSIALAAGIMALATPAKTREIQWCAVTKGSAHRCMYHTEEQCRASISGRGGTCVPMRR